MKKIIAMLLLMAISLSILPVYSSETVTESRQTGFLKAIGVLEKGFSENSEITKGEFTKRVVNLLYPDADFSNLNPNGAFFDVTSDTMHGAYIRAAKNLGIVNGGANNMFHPESKLTTTDAIVIACNALGYSLYAKDMGGYPTGYLTVGVNKGLTKGELLKEDKADGKFVAKLLYNMLFLFPATVENISVDGIKISENRISVLETVYNIKKYDAVLTDNGITSVDGVSIMDEERCTFLDSKTGAVISAYSDSSSIGNHLGCRMDVYILYNEEKGRSEIVNYVLSESCEEYLINADRVVKFDESGIEYEEEKNSSKTTRISFKNSFPPVILNGVLYAGYDLNSIVPEDGFLRVPVNGGAVSLVEIISFNVYGNKINSTARNIVVDTFDLEEGYINCRLSPANSLKIEENDIVKIIDIKDNGLNYLKKDEILSVAQSYEKVNGNTVYLLFPGVEKLEGSISGTAPSDKTVTVGDKDYEVSDSLLNIKKSFFTNIKYNEPASFYMDVTGKIAYTSSNITATKNYVYILASAVRTTDSKTLRVKVLDKEGGITDYAAGAKIKIDGVEYTDHDRAYSALNIGAGGSIYTQGAKKPAILTLNSKGEIRAIDTDKPNMNGGSDINIYSTHSHIKYSNEEVNDKDTLKAGYRNPRVGYVNKGNSYTVDGRFYLNSDTVIFTVPEIDMYGLDKWSNYASMEYAQYKKTPVENVVKMYEGTVSDEYYRIYDLASINPLIAYDIQGYDIDPDTGYAGLVVLRGRNDVHWYGKVSYAASYPMSIFLRTAQVYDEELDRELTKVYYTVDGKTESSALIDKENTFSAFKYLLDGATASENKFSGTAVSPLKQGDVIRIIANDGRISHIERVFKSENLFHTLSSTNYAYIEPTPYNTTLFPFDERTVYSAFTMNYMITTGYVRNVSGSTVKLMLGKQKVDTIDPATPSTYTEQFYDVSNVTPVLITLKVDSSDPTKVIEATDVRQGNISDIITTDEVSQDTDKASLVIIKSTSYNVQTMYIINREVI